MKIDIGGGKILGTKRVSPNGQISGFREYAGQEVLVILPEGEPQVRLDAREALDELREATVEHMRIALRETEELRDRYGSPREAAREFLDATAPRSFRGLKDRVDTWIRDQAATARTKARQAADRATDAISDPRPERGATKE